MMYVHLNLNRDNKFVGDCVVRAIAKLLNQYLKRHGFKRYVIPNTCPDCYTVADFAADHPTGKYLLFVDKHVVAVEDGNYFDSWDSGYRIPIYYFSQE